VIRRVMIQGQTRQMIHETSFQNNWRKINWRYGSSSRTPALQVWSPEFKPQSHPKKCQESSKIEQL
jgi:hypothetical protein